jgi:hypothetical protein
LRGFLVDNWFTSYGNMGLQCSGRKDRMVDAARKAAVAVEYIQNQLDADFNPALVVLILSGRSASRRVSGDSLSALGLRLRQLGQKRGRSLKYRF